MRYEVQYLPARMVRKIAEGGEYQNESRMLTDAFVRRLTTTTGCYCFMGLLMGRSYRKSEPSPSDISTWSLS